MPSNHLILCCPLLHPPSIFPSIRVFSSESVLHIRWPKFWSFSFGISLSNEYSRLISLRIDWSDLRAVQESLKSLLQHHSTKPSILGALALFKVQLSYPYMTTGKTIALTRWAFVGKVVSLLFNKLSRFAMEPHSSTLAWKVPWMEEPGGLQSMGSLRVGHDWATSLSLFTLMHWRRKWKPTPVFLPGESQGPGSLVGCHLWGRTESDTTERLSSSSRLSQRWPLLLVPLPFPVFQCFRPLSVLQNHLSFHFSWSLPMQFPLARLPTFSALWPRPGLTSFWNLPLIPQVTFSSGVPESQPFLHPSLPWDGTLTSPRVPVIPGWIAESSEGLRKVFSHPLLG